MLTADISKVEVSIKNIEEKLNTKENTIEMSDINNIPAPQTQQLFSDLFKVNENNKTLTEPLHNLNNILSNNESEKIKREYNLIIFGLKVKQDDKSYNAVRNLFKTIGVNDNLVQSVVYLKKKDSINEYAPIKIITTSLDAKYSILKAGRKLKELNQINNTKISIALDLSDIDRQLNKKLIEQRNDLNSKLNLNDSFYYGIRNNKIIKIIKRKQL